MALPIWDPLLGLTHAAVGGAGLRVSSTCLTALLNLVGVGFLVASGFAILLPVVGFPSTALIFAALFAALALTAFLMGRQVSARHAAQVLATQNRAKADIALAAVLARSNGPLLPIADFLAAFILARRP